MGQRSLRHDLKSPGKHFWVACSRKNRSCTFSSHLLLGSVFADRRGHAPGAMVSHSLSRNAHPRLDVRDGIFQLLPFPWSVLFGLAIVWRGRGAERLLALAL